jgi:hypothetical protein
LVIHLNNIVLGGICTLGSLGIEGSMVAMASFLHHRMVVAMLLALMMVTTEAFQASDWQPAHATFYGDSSGLSDDMGMSRSNTLSSL